ncbi:MAG: hypothetical protein CMH03_11045 [Marinovum sp.]|jgi:hypothetical protein|nr:hypothetical protein [Marinovum sp.]|tara:strand:- start:366 stop:632 length:267 start_codon:yes stop_codon:yes gene_type:complete
MSLNDNEIITEDRTEERYFSRSKNQWIYVSDMTDVHIRRAFKRLLKMIRLGELVEKDDVQKPDNKLKDINSECEAIKKHAEKIQEKIS